MVWAELKYYILTCHTRRTRCTHMYVCICAPGNELKWKKKEKPNTICITGWRYTQRFASTFITLRRQTCSFKHVPWCFYLLPAFQHSACFVTRARVTIKPNDITDPEQNQAPESCGWVTAIHPHSPAENNRHAASPLSPPPPIPTVTWDLTRILTTAWRHGCLLMSASSHQSQIVTEQKGVVWLPRMSLPFCWLCLVCW